MIVPGIFANARRWKWAKTNHVLLSSKLQTVLTAALLKYIHEALGWPTPYFQQREPGLVQLHASRCQALYRTLSVNPRAGATLSI